MNKLQELLAWIDNERERQALKYKTEIERAYDDEQEYVIRVELNGVNSALDMVQSKIRELEHELSTEQAR